MEGWGSEEGGGEGGLGGGEEVGEAFEDGHLVDELVDVGNIGRGGEADAGEERGGFREGCGGLRGWSWGRGRCCGGHCLRNEDRVLIVTFEILKI